MAPHGYQEVHVTRGNYDGLDVVESIYRDLLPDDDVDQAEPIELDDLTISYALLLEMQRPPWWRENEADRRAQRKEAA